MHCRAIRTDRITDNSPRLTRHLYWLNAAILYFSGTIMKLVTVKVDALHQARLEDGVCASSADLTIHMNSGAIVRVNGALIYPALDPALGAVRYEGDYFVVTRASLQLGTDGSFELVPERDDDTHGEIVFVDVAAPNQ
jgi:hypothetical protein